MARTHSRYYFAKYLADNGFKVDVLKSDRLHGFMCPLNIDNSITEENKNINIHSMKAMNWSILGDILAMMSFTPDQFYCWYTAFKKNIHNIIKNINLETSAILSIYPAFTSLMAGHFIKEKYNIPFIVDFRDEFLDVQAPSNGRKRVFLKSWEEKIINSADLISVSTNMAKDSLQNRYQISDEKISVTHNGYDQPITIQESVKKNKDTFKIIYAGAISAHQKPEILCQAYKLLLEKRPDLKNKLSIDFYGPDRPYFHMTFKKHLMPGIAYKGFVPYDEVQKEILKCDFAFTSLADEKYTYAIPRKIFDYINFEKPILAAFPKGEAQQLIENNKLGLVSHYDDIESLSNNILRLIEEPKLAVQIKNEIQKKKSDFWIGSQIKTLGEKIKILSPVGAPQ